MNLSGLFRVKDWKTDKGTTHDYIDGYYNDVFTPVKNEKLEILEIGIHKGASIELWSHFFPNANIVGLDNTDYGYQPTLGIRENNRNITIRICDGYADEWVNRFDNDRFDFIIDDGPHTLDSQLLAIKKYLPKVKIGGKLIIEDIQSISDLNKLVIQCEDNNLEYQIFDLRSNKGRYDDIILEITKTK